MKKLLLLPCLLLTPLLARAADCCDAPQPASTTTEAPPAAPAGHPLKGVVKGLLPEKSALLVKHEEVPGVMHAMTMMFKVSPDDFAKVQRGDAIQARIEKRADGWWLTGVSVVPPAK